MRNKLTTDSVLAISLMAIQVPLFAHHGTAAFETSKTITMKATVTDWYWANPHCFVKFDYRNDKGDVEHWVVESSNPPDMTNKGWTIHTLKPGDEITVTVHPVKNGKPIGRVVSVMIRQNSVRQRFQQDTGCRPQAKCDSTLGWSTPFGYS